MFEKLNKVLKKVKRFAFYCGDIMIIFFILIELISKDSSNTLILKLFVGYTLFVVCRFEIMLQSIVDKLNKEDK